MMTPRSLRLALALALAAPVALAAGAARADMPPDDTTPPSVAITSPKNNSVLEAPASFVVSVSATDIGLGIKQVDLTLDGAAVGDPDTETPYAFNVNDLAAGAHTLKATATDLMGNTASSEVMIEVSSGESGGATESSGGGEEAPGCGCRHAGDGSAFAALLLALGMVVRRRR
ncbi:MAG: Ig-like domain-containing protein [Nannocystaceae bacterium]